MKKRVIAVAAASAVTLATAVPVLAHAQTPTDSSTAKPAVSHHRMKHARLEARLNQAVRDKIITTDQKDAFTAELKKLRQEHKIDISKSSTNEERQAERTKLKSELQAWATANNFPLSAVMPNLNK